MFWKKTSVKATKRKSKAALTLIFKNVELQTMEFDTCGKSK